MVERSTYMFAGKLIAYSIDGTLTTTAAGHLGSTEITNTNGSIARQTYLPYGNTRSNTTNQLTTDKTYTGQTDDGLGWMHYRARQYDPTLGRFLQADTITTDGLNRYTYVRNNPLNATDPTGMCSEIVDGACVIWGNGWSYNHGMVMPSELRAAYLYSGNGPSTGSGTSGSRAAAFIRALAGPGIDKVESGLAKIGTCLSATLHGSSCSKGGVTQIDRAVGSETAQILIGAAEIGVGTAMIISPTASEAIQCYEGVTSGCAGLALTVATAGIVYGGAAWIDDIARATNRAQKLTDSFDNQLRALSTSQQRAVRSLQQQVASHTSKLEAYKADQDAFDNLGILGRAPTDQIRQSIIDGRIRHLTNEIQAFQDQIDKLLGGKG